MGQEPERALKLALTARATYAQAPILHANELSELDSLLKQHGARTAAAPGSMALTPPP